MEKTPEEIVFVKKDKDIYGIAFMIHNYLFT